MAETAGFEEEAKKAILKSRTVKGIILTALPTLNGMLMAFGFDLGTEWVESVGVLSDQAFDLALNAVGLAGAVYAFYGRMKAKVGLVFGGSKEG